MTQENIRVYDLAKESNLSTKDVIDILDRKFEIKVKSHSSTLTAEQVRLFKESLKKSDNKNKVKPKAFIVKKAKPVQQESQVEAEKENDKAVEEKTTEPEKSQVTVKPRIGPKIIQSSSSAQPRRNYPQSDNRPSYNRDNRDTRDNRNNSSQDRFQQRGGYSNQRDDRYQRPSSGRPYNSDRPYNSNRPYNSDRPFNPDRQNQNNNQSKYPPRNRTENKPFEKKKFFNQDKSDAPRPQANQDQKDKQPIKRHIISPELYANRGFSKRKPVQSKKDRPRSKEEEQERISLEKAMAQKHKKKVKEQEEIITITKVIINQPMTIAELSDKIQKTSAEIVKFLMMQGMMVTVNQVIDVDTAKKVAQNFELEVLEEDLDAYIEEELEKEEKANALKNVDENLLKSRAPVVSIMGHVDHGKTTLLDSIRAAKHNIVSTEVGGITQSIGAYTVHLNKKKIVFIDTPGHEAFTEMRARGAKATDIAILVVAADDGIMPQTIEAINHAKAAEVPIIVAINKIDKPSANPDKILQQLTEHGLVPEAWGGDTICVKVSAIQGSGIDELLEYILLTAEMLELKAQPSAKASGVVIEANLDKGKGAVATLLVQNGTLKIGDCLVVGSVGGKVRALLSDSGERVKKAPPSTPVEILGLSEIPQAGDTFEAVSDEKEMKRIVDERKTNERLSKLEAMKPAHVRSDILGSDNQITTLNLIIKANTHGSAEAVAQAVMNLESKEIVTKLIHVGVGDISEADIMLASASNAIILGFTVKEDHNALIAAEKENVKIKKFDIIYKVLEDLEQTMLHLLQPELKEVELGKAEVRQIFTIGKTAKIAGCYVLEGKIIRNKTAMILRNGTEIFKGQIDQLKRFKDDVKEVAQGFECGISFDKFNDLQAGDIIEVSTTQEIERQSLE